jgi:hypothetical protein
VPHVAARACAAAGTAAAGNGQGVARAIGGDGTAEITVWIFRIPGSACIAARSREPRRADGARRTAPTVEARTIAAGVSVADHRGGVRGTAAIGDDVAVLETSARLRTHLEAVWNRAVPGSALGARDRVVTSGTLVATLTEPEGFALADAASRLRAADGHASVVAVLDVAFHRWARRVRVRGAVAGGDVARIATGQRVSAVALLASRACPLIAARAVAASGFCAQDPDRVRAAVRSDRTRAGTVRVSTVTDHADLAVEARVDVWRADGARRTAPTVEARTTAAGVSVATHRGGVREAAAIGGDAAGPETDARLRAHLDAV